MISLRRLRSFLRHPRRRTAGTSLRADVSAITALLPEALEQRLLLAADFGDAPAGFPVLLADNGARHEATGPTLGAARDAEADGVISAGATGDDTTGSPDDEDGVDFTSPIQVGQLDAQVTVTVQNAPAGARLDVWVDFNHDRNWGGVQEQVAVSVPVVNGPNTILIDVPGWTASGTTFARFRLSTTGGLSVYGAASDGEVEDHALTILPPAEATGILSTGHVVTTSISSPSSVSAADMDGDGDMDLLSTSFNDDRVTWYENDGAQNFTVHDISTTVDAASWVVPADLDRDGDMDLVTASREDDTVAWFENDGNQNFTKHVITNTADAVATVDVADIDGDGDLDVTSASFFDNQLLWYENDGNQGFTEHTVSGELQHAFATTSMDLNRDGNMDVLSGSNVHDNRVSWHENDGSENFAIHTFEFGESGLGESVRGADIDGDGDLDVIASRSAFTGDRIVWYQNDGNLNFGRRTIFTTDETMKDAFPADIDGDGDFDVLGAPAQIGSSIAWYENDGTASFTRRPISAISAYAVFPADVDGDGDLDVVIASQQTGKVGVYWFESVGGLDFGDAPASYPVTLAENGARHELVGLSLGAAADKESDGVHSASADADDLNRLPDDEDGVTLSIYAPGQTGATVRVNSSSNAKLSAWIDFNRDGDWNDAGEQIFADTPAPPGDRVYTFNVPTTAVVGTTFARFRLSTVAGLGVTGLAPDGEVEDYPVSILLTPPVITGPAAVSVGLPPVFSWNSVTGAANYELFVWNVSASVYPFHQATVTGTLYTPSAQFGIGRYTAWMRSFSSSGIPSIWSPAWNFTLNSPAVIHPLDSQQATSQPTFSWDPVPGAVGYDVWLTNLSTGESPWLRQTVQLTSFTPDVQLPIGRYQVWVRAFADATAFNVWSTPVNFSVVAAPHVTEGGNSTFDRTPTFGWTEVVGAVQYNLMVRNQNTGQTVISQNGITSLSWTPATALPDGPYRWWAQAEGPGGFKSLWSDPSDIFVGGRPVITTPSGTTVDRTPTIIWTVTDLAVRYELQVDQVGGSSGIILEGNVIQNSFVPRTALPPGTYRAWVRAVSSTGEFSPWSVAHDFTIAASDATFPPADQLFDASVPQTASGVELCRLGNQHPAHTSPDALEPDQHVSGDVPQQPPFRVASARTPAPGDTDTARPPVQFRSRIADRTTGIAESAAEGD